jgi:hypothetical protein
MDDALEVLSAIERAEARLLAWGVVDGAFADAELLELIEDALSVTAESGGVADLDPEDVFDELVDRQLVVRAPEQPSRYRSRMAETIRLLARLRQLFPKHEHGAWATAPRLVADFRLAINPRRYPARDIPAEQALDRIAVGVGDVPPDLTRTLRSLLTGRGDAFQLAEFQIDATASILRALQGGDAGATIVTAGTGSGKTFAFYLPVLATIAAGGGREGPQALAVYPRNELLKDQLSQTYAEARRLDGATASGRPVSVGAFFGPTPQRTSDRDEWLERGGWVRHGDGRVCPYLRCPSPGCTGPMVWRDSDRSAGRERLECAAPRCSVTTTPEALPLTRERMRQAPPDVLFTSTEMLNRNLSSWEHARVFGLRAPHPRIALIDEAHTYAGVAGAQAAMLLRRWHAAAGGRVHFVGLSATLVDAAEFFARLTGVPESAVTLVEPVGHVEEGMEYQVALRGDPAAGTQLLSTTIQASMALRRMLDPIGRDVSHGAFGSKLFVFTDDLDVTNRLYHALRDAEGLGPYGNDPKRDGGPLAALRATSGPDVEGRRRDGQAWDVAERLGHDLSGSTRLDVSRTSSQDIGVSERSDVIVATASLEVGFNDPGVGGVIQHKAPRDEAAFIQRRGRAGRTRQMRPWTVIALSDFGRDRLAYEAYDVLFDPGLRARPLPISNRAVVRMQSTYAWMDWCARRLAPGDPTGSVWRDLAGPADARAARDRQAALAALIEQTLDEPATLADLTRHLQRSLQLSNDQVETVLWEPPRSLMTAVLPTALRRLRTRWYHPARDGGGEGKDFRSRYDPLPDFVPPNLFSELTLPEVQVVVPPQNRRAEEEEHSVPILQALRTFAPGNVSLRFAIERRGARSWVAPPEDGVVAVEDFIEHHEELGAFTYTSEQTLHDVDVARPWRMRSSPIPADINDSSGGRLHWRTQIHPGASPHSVLPPDGSPWAGLISSLDFHTHSRHSPATVRRFATGGEFSTLRRGGTETQGSYTFTRNGQPAALGFELDVDGFAVRLQLPLRCAPDTTDPVRTRGFRLRRFAGTLADDPQLQARLNVFKRTQVEQVYLAALSDRALSNETSLMDAWQTLHAGDAAGTLVATAHALYDAAVPAAATEDEGEERRGLDRLIDLLADSIVIDALKTAAPALWEVPNDTWEPLARDSLRATIAAAVAEACSAMCPEFSTDEIVVDIDPGVQPDRADESDDVVWVTERVVGGGGVIEELHRRCAENPRRFFKLLSRALDPGDFEVVDTEVPRAIELATADGALETALQALRDANTHQARRATLETMVATLTSVGIDTRHAVVAALNARLVRPGASAQTDVGLKRLIEAWHQAERTLGIDLEARVFALHCRDRAEFDGALPEMAGWRLGQIPTGGAGWRLGQIPTGGAGWRFGQILSLLWPHGWRARAEALQAYNEFAPHPPTDRLALRPAARASTAVVRAEGDWWPALEASLVHSGVAVLRCPRDDQPALAEALVQLGIRAVDTGALLLHPWIESVRYEDGAVDVEIAVDAPGVS